MSTGGLLVRMAEDGGMGMTRIEWEEEEGFVPEVAELEMSQ